MIPNRLTQRVFKIEINNLTATCFIFDYKNYRYYITAKHVLEGCPKNSKVKIYTNGQFYDVNIEIIGHSEFSDTSVFKCEYMNIVTATYLKFEDESIKKTDITYGQDLHFLGYPFGIEMNFELQSVQFTMPLVKKALLSGISKTEKFDILFLDGINNPGFSGGPVVSINSMKNEYTIVGVISGYRANFEELKKVESNDLINVPGFYTSTNTGIIHAYPIKSWLDIINKV